MRAALDWLDHRTGFRGLLRGLLDEDIPGGARWRYVFGSALALAFAVQALTGVALWMAYSPSAQTAWESVYYLQHEMRGGWFLRGLHHYMAQAAIVLLALHLVQVVVAGAYRAPREVNFWCGLVLMQLLLGLGITGYLLPWDQKGYWATKVATNLLGLVPGAGPVLQRLAMGGPDYGHHTLSRFFALHAGVLPALVILVLVGHVYLFRRHGVTVAPGPPRPDGRFWPDQALRDGLAGAAVLTAVVGLVVARGGAPLGAPADPSIGFPAARPEWYFLSLFQLMKLFPGRLEVIGGVVIPGALMGVLAALPWLGRWQKGHRFAVAFVVMLIASAAVLTLLALRADSTDPDYRAAVLEAETSARRAVELAEATGIPSGGAADLLRHDPLTQGPRLFARHCAKCHRYGGHDGQGRPTEEQRAADLRGFASIEWLEGLLDKTRIDTDQYYGGTRFEGGAMSEYLNDDCRLTPDQLRHTAAALSAEAQLPGQRETDARRRDVVAAGLVHLRDAERGCARCHRFHDAGLGNLDKSPDLTGYGTREWIAGMIDNPAHARFYGSENDDMPAFGAERLLTAGEIGVLADWLRGDWVPSGGPAAGIGGSDGRPE
jgi:ubiquinol-cytochrome c reductase cytochrome b subunit